jgi:hypothetical protein
VAPNPARPSAPPFDAYGRCGKLNPNSPLTEAFACGDAESWFECTADFGCVLFERKAKPV